MLKVTRRVVPEKRVSPVIWIWKPTGNVNTYAGGLQNLKARFSCDLRAKKYPLSIAYGQGAGVLRKTLTTHQNEP
ncbi:hypothetical protein GCM10011273_16430 [Asticcacaulis endophyticus]|uniref:Uncharacterized protein n=1 Tax=Asticcacaulis endophyticus TaxID=1395890 RepID=A0A918USQ7_9CAUL|nr:hypothetical protein GCM10011273_16430 [Asticcacaulis endophyticus]